MRASVPGTNLPNGDFGPAALNEGQRKEYQTLLTATLESQQAGVNNSPVARPTVLPGAPADKKKKNKKNKAARFGVATLPPERMAELVATMTDVDKALVKVLPLLTTAAAKATLEMPLEMGAGKEDLDPISSHESKKFQQRFEHFLSCMDCLPESMLQYIHGIIPAVFDNPEIGKRGEQANCGTGMSVSEIYASMTGVENPLGKVFKHCPSYLATIEKMRLLLGVGYQYQCAGKDILCPHEETSIDAEMTVLKAANKKKAVLGRHAICCSDTVGYGAGNYNTWIEDGVAKNDFVQKYLEGMPDSRVYVYTISSKGSATLRAYLYFDAKLRKVQIQPIDSSPVGALKTFAQMRPAGGAASAASATGT